MGKWQSKIMQVLNTYQGPPLVQALEIMLQTAEEKGIDQARDNMADEVCEGLHPGPGAGLKCRRCYDAELNIPEVIAVEAEIEAARLREEATNEDDED